MQIKHILENCNSSMNYAFQKSKLIFQFYFILMYLCRVLWCWMITREKWQEIRQLRTADGRTTAEKNRFEKFFTE